MAVTTKVWLSKTSDYENFEEGVKDADAFTIGVPTTNTPIWIQAIETLLFGTTGDEWRLGTNKTDGLLSATNFLLEAQSNYGSADIGAMKVNETVLFNDFVGRKVREMTYSDPKQKYVAPDLTALAEHITLGKITCFAHQKNPDSIVWVVLADGTLKSMNYDRDQNVIAWSNHPIDGFVMSVCVTPAANEDEVWLSVGRTINGDENTYIERFASRIAPTSIEDNFYVDCGITYDGTASNTISVLDANSYSFLEGETVSVLADGVVIKDLVVAGGIVTLPNGLEASVVQVGLPYTTKVQPMRIVIDTPKGTSMGSVTRVPELVLSLLNTGAAKYGTNDTDMMDINLTDASLVNSSAVTGLFTGDVPLHNVGGFNTQIPIIISTDSPLPFTLRAIIPKLEVTGR